MLSIERKISLVRIFILCIANTIIITLSSAQLPYIKQFSTQDGLCGGLVYYTMQDSKGYIWSACKQGISMFNGHEFKSFTIKDGLPSNDVWRIDEDEFGRLWMSTFGGICYYEDGKIKKSGVFKSSF